MNKIKKLLPGLFITASVSYSAVLINRLISRWINPEAVTIAIILSIIISNLFKIDNFFSGGNYFFSEKTAEIGNNSSGI